MCARGRPIERGERRPGHEPVGDRSRGSDACIRSTGPGVTTNGNGAMAEASDGRTASSDGYHGSTTYSTALAGAAVTVNAGSTSALGASSTVRGSGCGCDSTGDLVVTLGSSTFSDYRAGWAFPGPPNRDDLAKRNSQLTGGLGALRGPGRADRKAHRLGAIPFDLVRAIHLTLALGTGISD